MAGCCGMKTVTWALTALASASIIQHSSGQRFPTFEDWAKVLYYNTGLEMSPKDIWDVAERANMVERLFNIREGMKKDDPYKGERLPDRYFTNHVSVVHLMLSALL